MRKNRLLFAVALLTGAATCPSTTNTLNVLPDDNGSVRYYQQLLPSLLGRRPHGLLEAQVLADLGAAITAADSASGSHSVRHGPKPMLDAVTLTDEFRNHWTEVILNMLQVQRTGDRAQPAACFGAPEAPAVTPAHAGDLAACIRDHGPDYVCSTSPFNMTDVIQSALALDDISVVYRAYLLSLEARPGTQGFADSERGIQEAVHRLGGRNMSCQGCHNSQFSVSSAGSGWNRHWPLPVNMEKALYDQAHPLGTTALIDKTNAAFRPDVLRPQTPIATNKTPWNIEKECAGIRQYTDANRVSSSQDCAAATSTGFCNYNSGILANGPVPIFPNGAANGTTFYLGLASYAGITGLWINLSAPAVSPANDPLVVDWQYCSAQDSNFNCTTWSDVYMSSDETNSFTAAAGWHELKYCAGGYGGACPAPTGVSLPAWVQSLDPNGRKGFWLRARKVSGTITSKPVAARIESWGANEYELRGFQGLGGSSPVHASNVIGSFAGASGNQMTMVDVEAQLHQGIINLGIGHWPAISTPTATSNTVYWDQASQAMGVQSDGGLTGCVKCHGEGGSVPYFRLDRYADTTAADGSQVLGAKSMAQFIKYRVQKGGDDGEVMPPVSAPPLASADLQTIVAWVDDGAWETAATPPVAELAETDGATAFALMLAEGAVSGIYDEMMGRPLTIMNGFPRNPSQRVVLGYLTRYSFPHWSVQRLIRSIANSPYFNRAAPAFSLLAPYQLPQVFNPWAAVAPDDSSAALPEYQHNGQGDMSFRYSPKTILYSAADLLGWTAPVPYVASTANVSVQVQQALGQYMSDADQGTSTIDTSALLRWEEANSPYCPTTGSTDCQQSRRGVNPDGTYDWVDKLLLCIPQGAQGSASSAYTSSPSCRFSSGGADVTVRELVSTIKDWLIQQPSIDPPSSCNGLRCFVLPSDEELALRDLFGVDTLDVRAADVPTTAWGSGSTPIQCGLECKVRRYVRVLLKSPQNLLTHIEPPAPGMSAPRMRVCLPSQKCSYQEICNMWAGYVAGYSVNCQAGHVTATALLAPSSPRMHPGEYP